MGAENVRIDAKKALDAHVRWAREESEKPWREWFAWYPVQDWFTGDVFWLETVSFKLDYQTARWNYRPLKREPRT